LIIDEISMVGCTMLTKIHLKLQKLKSSPFKPFGGLNIMFLGKFMQFPPISDTPLYTSNIKPPLIFTKQKHTKIIGKVYGKTMYCQIKSFGHNKCDKVKTFHMLNCSIIYDRIKLLKMIFHYSNLVFYQNHKLIYLNTLGMKLHALFLRVN